MTVAAGPSPGPAVPLFDGTSLDGWAHVGDGDVRLVDGVLRTEGGMGLLWYRERTFTDFVVEVTWRVSRSTDNSGVFLRFPDPGGDVWAPVEHGYEVQILDDADDDARRTGAIYTFAAPRSVPTRPPGTWNRFDISVVGQHYAVAVNGEPVTELLGDRALRGHVGLQNHDVDSHVEFAAVVVRELA